ncbi:uncharacterized protein BXZ73DRAFT_50604 [Epithele typhae]|uniref:uncharacterized protein n=1 Tax=Epithele typhae TaxID=378194 RepID=UPI002007A682|nr:uncharacterized protein BXZ73DRAFT_50604 [Epithele typhae]KAH9924269.1 hypothetical protein BXZ73DRAFT_50604 [Epithele typhae]
MSPSPSRNVPHPPAQTNAPRFLQEGMRRRSPRSRQPALDPRDTSIVDQAAIAAAQQQCFDSPNSVFTCYPIDTTVVAQHEWASIVWNSRLPQFAQTNLVNLFVVQADTGVIVWNATNVTNPANISGLKHAQVDDAWFGDQGLHFSGKNRSFPFYWLITRNDREITNTDVPQATFTAVQTTILDSVSSSIASVASASSASAASAATASPTPTSGSPSSTSLSDGPQGASPTGQVQNPNGSSSFPKWAIAVITVLGFFALVASVVLVFYIMRRLRQRRQDISQRNSMGSSTPMMANVDTGGPTSPTAPLSGGFGAAAGAGAGAYAANRTSSPTTAEAHGQDGASMISRTSDQGLFSGADAAIMANAFRQALRKPDFADRPVIEGESPDDQHAQSRAELINQELAEEGRDIRSVSSSRGVKVETLSDDGNDTATVHH